ncbi:MAG: PEP-CTERM sorting domain-containing protein [Rubrivivax sp.]|nr:MAG: PEP-CTERM sorting domain-containing protein [Rubrivivax sp.]
MNVFYLTVIHRREMTLNSMKKSMRAFQACGLTLAMFATGGLAQAAPGSFNLGVVSTTPIPFSATPALPALTFENRDSRVVEIDDTYNFTVTTQSALTATLNTTSAAGMGGVLTWNLNYALLDAQSNVVATGVLDPNPVTWMGGRCQTVQGQQVNCTDTYRSYTTKLAAHDLQAGQYQLRVTGTELAQMSYAGETRSYLGTVTTAPVPEPGTALSLTLGLAGLAWVTRRQRHRVA